MNAIAEKTVAEIALENPAGVRVFESLGIDYCCGGKRPLTDACARARVDVHRVLMLLQEAGQESLTPEPEEWSARPLGELIQYIVEKHHAFVRRETPRLETLLAKVVARHSTGHTEMKRIEELFVVIGQELSTHLMKEEEILFPYIRRMEQAIQAGGKVPPAFFGSVRRPITNMIAEHDDAGALLSQIRNLTNDYLAPEDACPTLLALYRGLEEFERDLHRHVHLENNILFPKAVEMEGKNELV
jgi:regulator of cell morphogenesis and NO signaling